MKIGLILEILGLLCPDLSIPPRHTHGKEHRFLVMQNLLRVAPEKGFCIEPVLLTRDNLEVHKK